MNVFGCQWDIQWEDKGSNLEIVTGMLREMRPPAGSLVVLPEMFATGFSMNADFISERIDGVTSEFLAKTAREKNIWLVGGVVLREGEGRSCNRAVVFDPQGKRIASYAKMRLFSPGGEHNHYQPGDRNVVFGCQGLNVGLFVCYDLRFPELFRALVKLERPPELMIVMASWPEPRVNHWVTLLQARAIENQAYVLGVNRTGTDPFHKYPGRSLFIDPRGEILADAGTGAGWVQGAVSLSGLVRYREELPFLRDWRSV